MRDLAITAILGFNWFVLFYFLALNSIFLVLLVAAVVKSLRDVRRLDDGGIDDIFANPLTPAISVIIPAYNEAACIVDNVHSMLELRYPEFEVVVVDDGSIDDTFELMREEFDLVEVAPHIDEDIALIGDITGLWVPEGDEPLVVLRKTNANRRGDAVNAGINAARHQLVCCVDADSVLEPDALLHAARPFVDDPERVIATGGAVRAINGSSVYRGRLSTLQQPKNWWVRIQIVEYLRSFLIGRPGWSRFGALLIISGAFGVYRRDLVLEVGGFDPTSIGEDFDILVALHRLQIDQKREYRVVHVTEPSCWTEVPPTRKQLASQRKRWSQGQLEVLWKQRGMIFNRRYGRVGMIGLPYYVFFEMLTPLVEIFGVAAVIGALIFGIVNIEFAILFAIVSFVYGILISVAALVVEEVSFQKYRRWRDLGAGLIASIIENLGFRQIHAWWRLRGLISGVLGDRGAWGDMQRSGFERPGE